jgi:hypothetical protein
MAAMNRNVALMCAGVMNLNVMMGHALMRYCAATATMTVGTFQMKSTVNVLLISSAALLVNVLISVVIVMDSLTVLTDRMKTAACRQSELSCSCLHPSCAFVKEWRQHSFVVLKAKL